MGKALPIIIASVLCLFVAVNLLKKGPEAPQREYVKASSSPPAAMEPGLKGAHRWERGEYGSAFIVGEVVNTAPYAFRYVQIQFSLFDEDGAQVGTAWDNINNLEAGGTWRFRATVHDQRAYRAKFVGITSQR
ncbi:MAG: hypothetical protein C4524_11360 [Candidatus Zixiibacteriota bacterium]|nr:MAG: hypothetical protein C4524_11360 [candidate division Zixibacteria bacterium]